MFLKFHSLSLIFFIFCLLAFRSKKTINRYIGFWPHLCPLTLSNFTFLLFFFLQKALSRNRKKKIHLKREIKIANTKTDLFEPHNPAQRTQLVITMEAHNQFLKTFQKERHDMKEAEKDEILLMEKQP